MIRIRDIHKTYTMGDQVVRALNGVTLTIEPGEFVAIMGPSGSGKSTLMHCLGLLDVPESGSFELLGREVSSLSEDDLAILRCRAIGFVFQQFNLLARTSAVENVALPQLYSQRRLDLAKATKHLDEVGLAQRVDHKPNELSGGQQQRVAIARALINDPKIILADEPTGNLDSKSEKEILALLTDLNAKGITVVVVTHEEDVARHTRRIIRMRDGVIVSDERLKDAEAAVQVEPGAAIDIAVGGQFFHEVAAHFSEGVSSLLANKVRSGLSMLGILIGVAAVIAMLALGRGAQKAIEVQLASLGSNLLVLRPGAMKSSGGARLDAGAVTRLTRDDSDAILRDIPGVKRVACEVNGRGQVTYGDKNWSTQVLATTPDYATMRASVPLVGRFIDDEDNRKRMKVAVIGLTVASNLFGDADPIGEIIKINKITFQVVGLLPEKGSNGFRDNDDTIVVPLTTGMRRLLGKDYVDTIDVEVGAVDDMERVQDEMNDLMIRRHRVSSSQDGFQIRNMADIQNALSETSRTMAWLLASIAAISLLVGGIGIMNIMLVSVTERTREIGLRKAVGARRRDIMAQFLIEAVVVSGTGGGLGILLGVGITFAMSAIANWSTSIAPDAVILASVFSGVIGIIFGIWPARKASMLSPIQALRYE